MKMSLPSLPVEILQIIILFLPGHDVETLALTFNKLITPLCLQLHDKCYWLHDGFNDRRMIALFGQPVPFDELGACRALHTANLREPFSPPSEEPVERLKSLEYLRLDGSLRWLKSKTSQASTPTPTDLLDAELLHSAMALGLAIPKTLSRLIQEEQLQHVIFPCRQKFRLFKPFFIKLIGSTKSTDLVQSPRLSIDGYACKFYTVDYSLRLSTNAQSIYTSSNHYYLYLDSQGGQSVISSSVCLSGFWAQGKRMSDGSEVTDKGQQIRLKIQRLRKHWDLLQTRTPVEREQCGVVCDVGDFEIRLVATSFEEFLVKTYFESWAFRTHQSELSQKLKLPDELKEYIIRVFTNEGRGMSRSLYQSKYGDQQCEAVEAKSLVESRTGVKKRSVEKRRPGLDMSLGQTRKLSEVA